PASSGHLHGQCERPGHRLPHHRLLLQDQRDQVSGAHRGLEHVPAALQRGGPVRVGERDHKARPERVHDARQPVVTSGHTQAPLLLDDTGPINISVPITLTLDPQRPFGGYSRNITHLYATVLGQQVGLSGRDAHEEVNITFTLPVSWSSDDCVLHGHCEQVVFSTCMTLTAASNIFPVTVQPPHCVPETYTNATSWYKLFTLVRDSDTKYSQDYNPFWCYKGAIGKVYHALNPKLTVIVPDDDRSLINLHLMHTSYFLFVMVITMFCYAVIKGRPGKVRQSSSASSGEFCPEKVQQHNDTGDRWRCQRAKKSQDHIRTYL
uniref:Transmembrane protein 248 n=1 Tax=Neogobius melanostomus TaxID=47308 RepID=A0A8C6SF00_9GOBI